MPKISVSIVSHRQIGMVGALLGDLDKVCTVDSMEVILTLNSPEFVKFDLTGFRFSVVLVKNTMPMGFSANHNRAFSMSSGDFFCVMNPDIRLRSDPFPALFDCLRSTSVGVVAPMVLNSDGSIEDSARRFPTPWTIVRKAFGKREVQNYPTMSAPFSIDWAGGMFLLFPRGVFERLRGFDQRYFLYYEDVDICARLRLLDYQVVLSPRATVVHLAQRSSHRKLKYFLWHLQSMVRFFLSPVFLRVQLRRLSRGVL